MDQITLITDEAINRADEHANKDWVRAALQAGETLAYRFERLTTDDIWFEMEDSHPDLSTHEPRAMGGVMRQLKSRGTIRPSTLYVKSERLSRHGAPIRVWMSRITKPR